jgi:hypothetical protein
MRFFANRRKTAWIGGIVHGALHKTRLAPRGMPKRAYYKGVVLAMYDLQGGNISKAQDLTWIREQWGPLAVHGYIDGRMLIQQVMDGIVMPTGLYEEHLRPPESPEDSTE